MPNDNWQHRSTGMRCKTCMYYVPKGIGEITDIGRCRRHAPTISGWPVMFVTDWCGDHKLDEASRKIKTTPLAKAVIESRQSVP